METKTPDSIVVPSNDSPTIMNNHAIDGALIGNILGGDTMSTVAGGVIGGMLGKDGMEREYREGHTVKKPASRGVMIAVNAVITGGIAALAAAVIPVAVPSALIIAGIGLLGAAIGGLMGNVSYNTQEREFENAQDYYKQHGGNYQGREREAQKSTQISADELALLKARLTVQEERSHTDRLAAQSAGIQQR